MAVGHPPRAAAPDSPVGATERRSLPIAGTLANPVGESPGDTPGWDCPHTERRPTLSTAATR